MTYSPLFYAAAIGLTYIASRHAFGPHVPQLHHIHDILFSIFISYSAIMDFESYVGSGPSVDVYRGETRIYAQPFSAITPYVFTVYALYKLTWERALVHPYDRLKYIIGLTSVAGFKMSGYDDAALAFLLYNAYGHIHVLDVVNRYNQAAGLIESYTYLRFRALMYMWFLLPVIWGHTVVAVLLYSAQGMVCALFVGYALYVMFETYIAVLDYGYNRALLRIDDRHADIDNRNINMEIIL
jgi:hypothetical protein